ncbi:hypothetical protein BGZ65_006668, partial [Modicella reniformis]
TDHAALKQLLTAKQPTERVARRLYRLSPYTYTIQNRQGAQHRNADTLSRYPNGGQHYDEVIHFVDFPSSQFPKTFTGDQPPELSRKKRRRLNRLRDKSFLEDGVIMIHTKRGLRRLLPTSDFHRIMKCRVY